MVIRTFFLLDEPYKSSLFRIFALLKAIIFTVNDNERTLYSERSRASHASEWHPLQVIRLVQSAISYDIKNR